MSTSDPYAPESHAPDLAAELRDAARYITAQDAYYDNANPNPGRRRQSPDTWDSHEPRNRRVS